MPHPTISRLGVLLTSVVLARSLPAQESREPAAPAGNVGQRALLAKMAEAGRSGPWLEALRQALAAERPDPNWVATVPPERGWLRSKDLEQLVSLNGTEEGHSSPRAVDLGIDPHPIPTIADFHRGLAEHGIEFLFVAIPVRVQVYPELLRPELGGEGFLGVAPGATALLAELEDRGVPVLNLLEGFVAEREPSPERDELFLDANAHWTPRGVELGARIVAERIRAQEWFQQGPLLEGTDFVVEEQLFDFATPSYEPPPNVRSQQLHLPLFAAGPGKPPVRLEDRESPILLLGDSFSNFYSASGSHFPNQLARYTGWKVDVVANRGGGVKTCRDALRRRRDDLAGKRCVIWMLPMPSLEPDRQWSSFSVFQSEQRP